MEEARGAMRVPPGGCKSIKMGDFSGIDGRCRVEADLRATLEELKIPEN